MFENNHYYYYVVVVSCQYCCCCCCCYYVVVISYYYFDVVVVVSYYHYHVVVVSCHYYVVVVAVLCHVAADLVEKDLGRRRELVLKRGKVQTVPPAGFLWLFYQYLPIRSVPTGSPSRGGDVALHVFDINQPSLPTPFYSVLVSVSVFGFNTILFKRKIFTIQNECDHQQE